MITNTIRNAFAIGALSLTLAACAGEDTATETQDDASSQNADAGSSLSEESLVMAQTAWLSITADGEVFTTFLDGDGRYRDVNGGTVRFGGTWEQNADRELCFTPDEGEGACWKHRAPGLNGTMRATTSDGRAIEVKKVAYTPPAASPQTAAEDAASPEAAAGDDEVTDGEDTRG